MPGWGLWSLWGPQDTRGNYTGRETGCLGDKRLHTHGLNKGRRVHDHPVVLKMIDTIDTQRALQAVERLQAKLKERGEVPTEEKLSLLRSVLQSPLFHQILALQKSVQHLRDQV
ncbi:hypothetical protein ILYODFUR_016943 [Ilyodon furcidens]|uniref:L27 domain-containing protein n=1 Tax=Ilyodon furcidens TaxID=33524 RepID=A0ABV0SXR8_9TELE